MMAGTRAMDMNDHSLFEIAKRDIGRSKQSATPMKDQQIFVGLDNNQLLSNTQLAKKTYQEIFGVERNQVAKAVNDDNQRTESKLSRPRRSIDSLKKQLHYINFSKQNFDLINKRKLGEIYTKFN